MSWLNNPRKLSFYSTFSAQMKTYKQCKNGEKEVNTQTMGEKHVQHKHTNTFLFEGSILVKHNPASLGIISFTHFELMKWPYLQGLKCPTFQSLKVRSL
jgi:hypothetical protein